MTVGHEHLFYGRLYGEAAAGKAVRLVADDGFEKVPVQGIYALSLLQHQGPMDPTHLASMRGVTRARMSQVLRLLENEAYVEVVPSRHSKRNRPRRITGAGRRFLRRLAEQRSPVGTA